MGFTLDSTTLFAALVVVDAVNLISSVLFFLSRPVFPGAVLWISGQTIYAAGSLLFLLRNAAPPVLGVSLGNTLYILGAMLLVHALWRFRNEKPFPLASYAIVLAYAISSVLTLDLALHIRVIMFSVVVSAMSFWAFMLSVQKGDRNLRLASGVLGVGFLLVSLFNAFRVIENIVSPSVEVATVQRSPDTLYYLLSLVSGPIMLYGYTLLASLHFELSFRNKEASLRAAVTSLQDLNKTQNTLISAIAHDLRNPIEGAQRYVEKRLLPHPEHLDDKRHALEVIDGTLKQTLEMLSSLLEWAKTQQEQAITGLKPLVARHLIDQALRTLHQDAMDKKQTVDIQAPGHHVLFGDETAAVTVLRNVFSNAIKFSPVGAKILIVSRVCGGFIAIETLDKGPGMSAEQLEALDAADRIISTTGSSGERGSGFGLKLAKELIHRQSGDIEIASKPGAGTEVRVLFRMDLDVPDLGRASGWFSRRKRA